MSFNAFTPWNERRNKIERSRNNGHKIGMAAIVEKLMDGTTKSCDLDLWGHDLDRGAGNPKVLGVATVSAGTDSL